MGIQTYSYERPREKLRNQGVRFLTLVELIQVIIGSGTARISGAKLARRVQHLITQHTPAYDELVAIAGLGDAKVCQLLAAIEFGRRLEARQQTHKISDAQQVQRFLDDARHHHGGTVVCHWLDGAGEEIDRKSYIPSKAEHYSVTSKHLFTDALAASARSIVVIIVTKNAGAHPNTSEMGLLKSVQETAAILTVHVRGLYAVYKAETAAWGNEV